MTLDEAAHLLGEEEYGSCNYVLLHYLVVKKECPDWLRGRHKLESLPRFNRSANINVPYVGKVNTISIGLRIEWIMENVSGQWKLDYDGFSFEKDTEAVMFKLRFS